MVQVRLNAMPDVAALMATKPRAGPIAGLVQAHARDELGRNWDIADLFQGAGYVRSFRAIVDELRATYDLA
jgi:hypothetical protein